MISWQGIIFWHSPAGVSAAGICVQLEPSGEQVLCFLPDIKGISYLV